MTSDEISRLIRPRYRETTAIAFPWSDLKRFFRLDLQGSEEVEGVAGIAKKQPKFPNDAGVPGWNFPFLAGGADQVYLWVPDPFMVKERKL